MIYRVTQKNARGNELLVGNYPSITAAENVIQKKLDDDAMYKLNNSYCLYEGMDDLIKEYTQADRQINPAEETSSSGQGKSQSFRPSPFSTTPQPKGVMPKWMQDDESEEDEK